MTTHQILLKDFNRNNTNIGYFINIADNNYTFFCRWNRYCDCAFLTVEDSDRKAIISSIALVNGLRIRHNKIPYVINFKQIYGETYEPTIDNIAKEFAFFYDIEDET